MFQPFVCRRAALSGTHHIVNTRVSAAVKKIQDLRAIVGVDFPARHVLEPGPEVARLHSGPYRQPDGRRGDGAGGVEVCNLVVLAPARNGSAHLPAVYLGSDTVEGEY